VPEVLAIWEAETRGLPEPGVHSQPGLYKLCLKKKKNPPNCCKTFFTKLNITLALNTVSSGLNIN
jgi:hypothetical protein